MVLAPKLISLKCASDRTGRESPLVADAYPVVADRCIKGLEIRPRCCCRMELLQWLPVPVAGLRETESMFCDPVAALPLRAASEGVLTQSRQSVRIL